MKLALALLTIVPLGQGDGGTLDQPRVTGVSITEFGLYHTDNAQIVKDSTSPDGVYSNVANIRLDAATATVPGKLGVEMGIKFTVAGGPPGAVVPIKIVDRFPAAGIKDPESGKILHEYETVAARTIGAVEYSGYSLDVPWEIVPGIWTIEIWYGDTKLAAQNFTVTKGE